MQDFDELPGPDRGGVEQEALLRRDEERSGERRRCLREDPRGGASLCLF